jgi:hypothetical protein
MKLAKLSLVLAVCGVLCTTSVFADDLRYPLSVWNVSTERDNYAFFDEEDEEVVESPSDMVIEDDPIIPVREPLSKDSCDPGGGKGAGCEGGLFPCMTGEAFSIWDAMTPCDGPLNVGGWVQAGFYNYNTGMFNNYPHNLNFNQVWLFAEKEADRGCGFDWGFRFDYVYGTDGPDTQAFGNNPDRWDEGWDSGNYYGHAIPQLYVDVAYNDLNVRVGHFYTIIGYEVVQAPDNFFYSHAFTMYHAEPFTHTGVLASYAVGDNVEVYGGWTSGWDTGFDDNGGDIFLGGLSLSMTDDITFIYALTAGQVGFGTPDTGYSHSIVIDFALTERLNYVFQTDYVDYSGSLFNRYGINQYLLYEINDCWAAGMRVEWFNAQVAVGDRADLYEATFGVNYKPHPNLILRPEIRWDQDNDGFSVAPARDETLGFGMDMILKF